MEIEKKMLKSIDFNGILTHIDTVNRMQDTIKAGLSPAIKMQETIGAGILTHIDTVSKMQKTIGVELSTQLDIIRQRLDDIDDDLYISEIFESSKAERKQYKYVKIESINKEKEIDNRNKEIQIIAEKPVDKSNSKITLVVTIIAFITSSLTFGTTIMERNMVETKKEILADELQQDKIKLVTEFIKRCKKEDMITKKELKDLLK